MNEKSKNWLTAAGVAALLAFAALAYFLHPGIIARTGVGGDDLGGGAMAALVLWLVLRKQRPMTRRTRLVLVSALAFGLLLGTAVFFMS
jgi:hypothetical protein